MTIHTVALDEPKFVRIIGSFGMSDAHKPHIGRVGKLVSEVENADNNSQEMIFVELNGDVRISVFLRIDVDIITEKEYFKGCLGG